MKKLLSLALIYSMLISFLTGCSIFGNTNGNDFAEETEKDTTNEPNSVNGFGYSSIAHLVPKGYTGGFAETPSMHLEFGYYWLETYEEVLDAIELLTSHGSTVKQTLGFNCDGDLLDVKWCFKYSRSEAEPLEEGKSFFDRRIDYGEFAWYGFYEELEIEKIYFDNVRRYGYFEIWYVDPFDYQVPDIQNTDDLSFDWFGRYDYGITDHPLDGSYYEVLYQGKCFAEINFKDGRPLPFDYLDDFLSTAIVVG